MKKEVMRKWVRALRSGKYKQTKGILKNAKSGGFCCLGVLCDLYAKEKKIKKPWKYVDSSDNAAIFSIGKEAHELPEKVRRWAGMHNVCGSLDKNNLFGRSLAEYNDNGKSFEGIAEIIEDNWAQL